MVNMAEEINPLGAAEDLVSYGWSSYSQYDEDGIIRECLRRISKLIPLTKTFIEIGCGNGLENNTHQMLLDGFKGIWVDGSEINIQYIENELGGRVFKNLLVVDLMIKKNSLESSVNLFNWFLEEESIDFFSLDIDGNDYHVIDPFVLKFKPKLICVEYNAQFPPPTNLVMKYSENEVWQTNDYFGASLQAWVVKFQTLGYELITCNGCGTNAFFVRNDLLGNFSRKSIFELYRQPKYNLIDNAKNNKHAPSFRWLSQILDHHNVESETMGIVIVKTRYGQMLVYEDDLVIGRSLRDSGEFQEFKVLEVLDFLRRRFNASIDQFVDIGANIGTHTVYALKKCNVNSAVCFEPDKKNAKLLRANIFLNGFGHEVDLFEIALTNQSGSVEMELSNVNYGDHRIKASSGSSVSFGEEYERKFLFVPAISLNDLVKESNINWSNALVWMDTQGHEGNIFDGGREFMKSSLAPKYIVSEFWPYGLERASGANYYFDFLESCKLIYDLDKSIDGVFQLVSIDELKKKFDEMLKNTQKEHHPHTNLLLIL